MTARYERRRAARETQRQTALMGESLAAFHGREVAMPPTLAQIYCENHKNRERCKTTADLFEAKKKRRRTQ